MKKNLQIATLFALLVMYACPLYAQSVTGLPPEVKDADKTGAALSDARVPGESLERVMIGYGSQKKGDVNGAISSVSSKEITDLPIVSVDQLLQGKVAGVTVTRNSGAPGSQTSVHIRGITSLTFSNEPLYIIDGIPVSGDAMNFATSGRSVALAPNNGESGVSPLALINPADIESIDVLKDASATAIYGSRASNGVIIITTKRGRYGPAHITYDGYMGVQDQNRRLPVMNLPQYAALKNALADYSGEQPRPEFSNTSSLGRGTNWQNEIFKTAIQQNHTVSVSGAKKGVDYFISSAYLDQDGTIIGNNFKRYSFRSNMNAQVKEWLTAGFTLSASRSIENATFSNNGGITALSLLTAPDQAVRNADGSFAGPTFTQMQHGAQANPVAMALDNTNNLVRSNVNGSVYIEVRIFKDLSLHSELDGNYNFSKNKVFQPTYTYGAFVNPTASLQEYAANSAYGDWKEYFSYTHQFGSRHNLSALLGHELTHSDWRGKDNAVSGFPTNNNPTLDKGDFRTAKYADYKQAVTLESAFARVIYTYNSKYSLMATLRGDRSLEHALSDQVGYFPSFAASWRLSDEAFMASFKKIADQIKIRIGYGKVGDPVVPAYAYGSALKPFTTSLGTGLDVSLLNNRIEASADVFVKRSKSFALKPAFYTSLFEPGAQFASLGGLTIPYLYSGQVSNKGYEFSISSHTLTGNLKWTTSLNFSHYKNRVVKLMAPFYPFITTGVVTNSLSWPVSRTTPGQPIGEFFGYKVKGIFKTESQLANAPLQFGRTVKNSSDGTWLGDVQYADINHDGKIDAVDQVPIGDPNPKATYGITNKLNFKGFDLSVFLYGSYGAKILNVLTYQTTRLSGSDENQLASVANFWKLSNPDSNIPAPKGGVGAYLMNSDRFIESGSYLRIQNILLGYTIPRRIVNYVKLSRLMVYASVQNLYTFTPYKGLDPEIGASNQNVFLTNVDQGRYPVPRTISFGINAEF